MSKKRRKQPGHFCWCCQRRRPNERFSGSGHARHLCRDCAKLGTVELAYRQNVRNIDSLLTWDGLICRRQRQAFERFLHHSDERVRSYAQKIAAQAEQERVRRREEWNLACEEDAGWSAEAAAADGMIFLEQQDGDAEKGSRGSSEDEIPF